MKILQLLNHVLTDSTHRTSGAELSANISQQALMAGNNNLLGPVSQLDPQQLERQWELFGVLQGLINIGINSMYKGTHNIYTAFVIVTQLLLHVSSKLKQPGAMISVDHSWAKNFSRGASCLGSPDFKLKESIAGSAIALREKQIMLSLRINMGNTPIIFKYLHRLIEPLNNYTRIGRSTDVELKTKPPKNRASSAKGLAEYRKIMIYRLYF